MLSEMSKKIIALHKKGLTPEQIEKELTDGVTDESRLYFLQKHSIEYVIRMEGE